MLEQNPKLIHAFGALAELGQEVANKNNFQETIRTSLHLLSGALGTMRGGVARYSRYGRELNMLAVRGLGDDFPLSLSVCVEDERQFLTNGLNAIDAHAARVLPFFQVYATSFERRRIELFVPLIIRDEIVGGLFLGEKATGEGYSSYEKEIICAMGRHIGVAISQRNLLAEIERHSEENRKLFDDLRRTYADTVKAFATELEWSPEQIEGAATAGYLHDVGKLTVERKIINAPYRINAKESAELNKHPVVGFEILQAIHHPFTDVPLAAKYHHERLDGRGYPDGLYDREIPYIAKVVNLADSFDAMTTDRPYKARRPAIDVVDDLRRNAGKQFAPELVVAFLRGVLRELKSETKDRRFRRLLGREYMEAEGLMPAISDALNELEPTTTLTYIAEHATELRTEVAEGRTSL